MPEPGKNGPRCFEVRASLPDGTGHRTNMFNGIEHGPGARAWCDGLSRAAPRQGGLNCWASRPHRDRVWMESAGANVPAGCLEDRCCAADNHLKKAAEQRVPALSLPDCPIQTHRTPLPPLLRLRCIDALRDKHSSPSPLHRGWGSDSKLPSPAFSQPWR